MNNITEPKVSLRCSEEPAIGTYPEADNSSLHHPLIAARLFLILSYNLCLGLPSCLFLYGFLIKILHKFSSSSSSAHCILLHMTILNYIWRGVQVMWLLTVQFFSCLLLFHSTWVQTFSSAPSSPVPVFCLYLFPSVQLLHRYTARGVYFVLSMYVTYTKEWCNFKS
jgi:hypothetical protein